MIELTVSADAAGQRLDKYVRRALRDVPLSHVYKMFRTRKVKVNEARGKPEQVLAEGDRVFIYGDEEKLLAKPAPGAGGARRAGGPALDVLFEDDDLFAVNKPSGLAAHPGTGISGATLVELVRRHVAGSDALPATEFKPSPAHRLDRETSGLLACGSAPEWTTRLKRAFADGQVAKVYLALALGAPAGEAFEVDAPLALTLQSEVRVRMHVHFAGAAARTGFEVLGRRTAPDGAAVVLLACHPRTGRQHQIRAHLHHAGLPLVGDKIYGGDELIFDRFTRKALTEADRAALRLDRHALHAWRLAFPHPRTGEPAAFEAPLPPDLQGFWDGCV